MSLVQVIYLCIALLQQLGEVALVCGQDLNLQLAKWQSELSQEMMLTGLYCRHGGAVRTSTSFLCSRESFLKRSACTLVLCVLQTLRSCTAKALVTS